MQEQEFHKRHKQSRKTPIITIKHFTKPVWCQKAEYLISPRWLVGWCNCIAQIHSVRFKHNFITIGNLILGSTSSLRADSNIKGTLTKCLHTMFIFYFFACFSFLLFFSFTPLLKYVHRPKCLLFLV